MSYFILTFNWPDNGVQSTSKFRSFFQQFKRSFKMFYRGYLVFVMSYLSHQTGLRAFFPCRAAIILLLPWNNPQLDWKLTKKTYLNIKFELPRIVLPMHKVCHLWTRKTTTTLQASRKLTIKRCWDLNENLTPAIPETGR